MVLRSCTPLVCWIGATRQHLPCSPDFCVFLSLCACAGRVQKIIKTKLLLEQPYIRDPNMNVDELVKSYVSKLGENIKVARFVRFNVGEGAESPAEEE